MIDLKERSEEEEIMDDSSISFDEFQETLNEIETINQLSLAYEPVLKIIRETYREHDPGKEFKVLDIGFGRGDYLRKIYHWGQANNINLKLTGVDLSPWSAKAAKMLDIEADIEYISANIFDFEPVGKFDVCVNSLFTHHLTNNEIVKLLQWMTQNTNHGWVINDLHRHPVAYYFIKYFTKILPFNRLVKNDAPLSVARAFRRRDWDDLLEQSGIDCSKIKISWHPSFRYFVKYKH